MVDVIFRDIDPDTLHRLLQVLDGHPVEIEPEGTQGTWTAELAELVLTETVPRATKLIQAVIDAGGEATVEDARHSTGATDLHHMVQSLNNAARRHGPQRHAYPTVWRPLEPVRERGSRGRVLGYRMTADAVDAFTHALAHRRGGLPSNGDE